MLFPRLFLLVSFAAVNLSLAQQQPLSPPPGAPEAVGDEATTNEGKTSYQAVNASIDSVLQQYELLTGKILIRDSNLTANALPLTISVPTPVPRAELARLIEASLLLNNYALIPASEPNTMKVINVNTGKNPRSEGVRLYAGPEGLPEADQVVSYYMAFRYVSANEALTIFQTHILPRAYTAFVPVNSSQALIITESTSVIRQLITLQQLIDVPPTKTVTEFVRLVRADAERVADTINKLLGTEGGGRTAGAAPGPQQATPVVPITSPEGGLLGSNAQLIPDTRTNRILIVCRPHNLAYLRNLIVEFDQASVTFRPLEYRLRYVSAGEVLPVLADLLTEEQGKNAQGVSPGQQLQQNQPQGGQGRGANLFGASSTNYSGGYNPTGGSAGSVGAGQDLLQEPNEQLGPQAVIVGKTRIISDSKDNKILVIGPPESLSKVEAILTRLDRRPQQVYLATVIGQLQLTRDFEFGVDFAQVYRHISGEGTGVASSNLNTGTLSGRPVVSEPTQLSTVGNIVNAAGGAASGLTIYGKISDAVSVLIKALDNRGNFKVLARPAVYTANNKRAVISSGRRVPVPESTLSNVNTNTVTNANQTAAVSATITYQDVELRLEVIPLINSNGEVTLKIAQINDSLGNNVVISGNSVPEVNSQRLTTTVTIPSGATVVLGGLIQETVQKSDNGIPYLDRIPYLGNLFRTHGESRNRTELLIFIQPTVVNDDVQTLRASIKEERRTRVGEDTYNLAHPSDYATSPVEEPAPRRSRNGK